MDDKAKEWQSFAYLLMAVLMISFVVALVLGTKLNNRDDTIRLLRFEATAQRINSGIQYRRLEFNYQGRLLLCEADRHDCTLK